MRAGDAGDSREDGRGAREGEDEEKSVSEVGVMWTHIDLMAQFSIGPRVGYRFW